MAVRLTYTSGTVDAGLNAEFETWLERVRKSDGSPLEHLIEGKRVSSATKFVRVDPSCVANPASVAYQADGETTARAVQAAERAAPGWRRTTYRERSKLLGDVADAIAGRHVEIAAVMSLETGKNRSEAILEVQEAIELIQTYAEQLLRNDGFVEPLASFVEDERNTEVLRPYGVFGVIAPFNFPLALLVGMSSAALLAGNTVVAKPSEDAPLTSDMFAQAVEQAELPAGVFNLVHGDGDVGRGIVDSKVDGIAFTGSAEVGQEIVRKLHAQAPVRPALMEMGGKNPTIVTANADLEEAAEGVARAAFGLSGQKCSACSRAIVLADVHDEFVERIVDFTRGLTVDEPANPSAFMGPVINEAAVERFESATATARVDGNVYSGGGRPDLPGYFVDPTIVGDLPLGHALTRTELFLPFLTVTAVASVESAIAEANATKFGLAAGIFSTDEAETELFLDEIEAGVVYVNRRAGATTGAWPQTQSFCGWKASGATGKGGLGPYYLQQFMREQSRTVVDEASSRRDARDTTATNEEDLKRE